MIKCAKCGEQTDEHYGHVLGSRGIHWEVVPPCICSNCFNDWDKYCDNLPSDYWANPDLANWRKYFQKWLGYKWKGMNIIIKKEKVIFT